MDDGCSVVLFCSRQREFVLKLPNKAHSSLGILPDNRFNRRTYHLRTQKCLPHSLPVDIQGCFQALEITILSTLAWYMVITGQVMLLFFIQAVFNLFESIKYPRHGYHWLTFSYARILSIFSIPKLSLTRMPGQNKRTTRRP